MSVIKILKTNNHAAVTVALPCYNAKKIGWLPMESLCNQVNVDFNWELIVCEEPHKDMLGVKFFELYKDRLAANGCVNITYLHPPKWMYLPQKWRMIADNADSKSVTYVKKAADCYSPSVRLSLSHKFVSEGYDWVDFTKGYFYNFRLNKIILYNDNRYTNLSMASKTSHMRVLPLSTKKSGIDGLIKKSFKGEIKTHNITTLYEDSVDTDGFNNISKRDIFYKSPQVPFFSTNKTLDDTKLPDYVIKRMKSLIIKP